MKIETQGWITLCVFILIFQNYFFNIHVKSFQVNSFVGDKVAAGGHQGYAALGGLYTQARPMVPHLYGNLDHQTQQIPVRLYSS